MGRPKGGQDEEHDRVARRRSHRVVGALVAGRRDETTTKSGSARLARPAAGKEPVKLDPAEFTTEIDNPYWPMKPGSALGLPRDRQEGSVQRVVVTVTDKTKRIANGVEARVVHDVATEDGEPVEITDDWYAQDADGNVWYLGRGDRRVRERRGGRARGRSRPGSTAPSPG